MASARILPGEDATSFLKERIGEHTRFWTAGDAYPLNALLDEFALSISSFARQQAENMLLAAGNSDSVTTLQFDDAHSLVAGKVPSAGNTCFVALLAGSESLAAAAVHNALEAWSLQTQVTANAHALEESAVQLAQSFEEQHWLRGFARNASSISKCSNANEIANGILQPLGYLLRAQDVFLLIHPEETERSGLVSAKFGQSQFTTETIADTLESLGIRDDSPPVVRNHLELETPDGNLSSLAAVSILGAEERFGFLVAVNRVQNLNPGYDPEFGSGDVGMLEEAAVLLATQAQNLHLLVQSNQQLLGTLHAMSSAIDARDPYTQGHSERVARLAFELAQIHGLSEEACQEIYLAGILHDIGKIGVPDRVLLKNGALTEEEFDIIRQHPETGYRIVERLGHLEFVLPGVLYHHERWDGKGYPHGLAGLAIPLMARILAVADAFDAMTSSRPYRDAMPVEKAHSIIRAGAAEQWDAEIAGCFEQWIRKRVQSAPAISPSASIIPQDSPLEQMLQAVTVLVN